MEEKTFDRRKILLICIGVLILILLVAGVTYAYFQHQIGNPASGNVGVDTDTPDNLVFDVSNDINITITQFNFGPDDGNQSDSAVASASLTANSTNDTANYTYYVYFKINTNEYVYTTQDSQTEILLKVTAPTGQPVTSIEGLTYNSTLGGFDITEANGTFAVASNYPITSNSSTTPTVQEWNFDVTFINLDTDQGENAGKKMDAEIIIQQNELKPTLAQYVISQYTGTDGENGLYYHDADLENGAGDNSYRYVGADPNNYVCFGSTTTPCPAENLYRIIGVLSDNGEYQVKLIKSDYTTSAMLGTDGRDYEGTVAELGMPTDSYKGNVDTSTIAAYRWNYDTSVSEYGSNNWTTSEFNTINLNTNYWNYLSATWQNLIATTTWHLGGMTSYSNTVKAFYDGERNNAGYGSNPTTYTDEIGLMYPSDYGYAAYPDAWATDLSSYRNSTITSNNWMYMGLFEWTITPYSSDSDGVFPVDNYGDLYVNIASLGYLVRPVFYLNSNVEYNGGTGTESDPFTLAV